MTSSKAKALLHYLQLRNNCSTVFLRYSLHRFNIQIVSLATKLNSFVNKERKTIPLIASDSKAL